MSELLVEQVRDWVGPDPDDDTIYGTLTRFNQDPLTTARAILKRRHAAMVGGYSSFKVDGDAEWSILATQMDAVQTQIDALTALIGDGPAVEEPEPVGLPTLASVPICGPTADR